MDPTCSTDKSVIGLDPFCHSRCTTYSLLFVSLLFLLYLVYLFIHYIMFVLLGFHFVSLSVYRGCWRMYAVPVIAQRTMSNRMSLYYLLLSTPLLLVS